MAKKISQSTIQNALGFKLSSHPREDYQKAGHAAWFVMHEAVTDQHQPEYEGGRVGFSVVGTGPVQAIQSLWPNLSDAEVASARGAIVKVLTRQGAAHVVTQGRRNTPSVWWVSDTFEPPENVPQPLEPAAPSPEVDEPIQAPTELEPAHNGREVPTLTLTEQSVPGDSLEDRLEKAFDMIREVVTEVREQNATLTTANERLTRKLEIVSSAISD